MPAELVAINNQILLYDRACRAIADATKIDEVKEWKDRAAAYQEYARQAKNKEMEQQAKEIRVRATRRMGQLLLMLNKSGGGRPSKENKLRSPMISVSEYTATLVENEIPHPTAKKWQALGKKSEKEFKREYIDPIYDDKPKPKPPAAKLQRNFATVWVEMIRAMHTITIEKFMEENVHGSYAKDFQKDTRQLITWLKGGLK